VGESLAPFGRVERPILRGEKHAIYTIRLGDDRASALARIYALGSPIQYSYLAGPLRAWHPQTRYATRPWASEMPSAGYALRWETLLALRARGARVCALTHAASLSSTGDRVLDATLPRPERYDVPEATARAVFTASQEGGRVIAIGTTVVRALEGAEGAGRGHASAGVTDRVVRADYTPRVVTGLVAGIHGPGESHFELLSAFAPPALLAGAFDEAEHAGYVNHEFGDSCLVLPGSL
jgi:S-adenosylmethionine:tRNA ribosyltransferase-isomerase